MTIKPVLSRTLDRCDVCGCAIHRMSLVRTQVDHMRPQGQNIFAYSSYNSTYWTTDTLVDEGDISAGTRHDRFRKRVNNDNSFTVVNGVQTWSGSGSFYNNTSIDMSSYDTMVFSVQAGPYYRSTSPSTTISLTIADSTSGQSQTGNTWVINSTTRIWSLFNGGSDYSDSKLYVTASAGDGEFWFDEMQLEGNVVVPGTFVPTSGSAVNYTTDSRKTSSAKVCRHCYEKILPRSTQRGVPTTETEPEIANDNQQF